MRSSNSIVPERRLTYDQIKALVASAKAKGWLSFRSDPAAAPIVWAGKEPARVRKPTPQEQP